MLSSIDMLLSGQITSVETKNSEAAVSDSLRPGVVVEKVVRGNAAEQAGIREGDVLLSWSRGTMNGVFTVPFDAIIIDTQQGAMGGVTIAGLRGEEKLTWTLGIDNWRMMARPNFAGPVLEEFRKGRELAAAGKTTEVIKHWRAMALETANFGPPWLHPWFLIQASRDLAKADQWNEALDLFREAIAGLPSQTARPMLLERAEELYSNGDERQAPYYRLYAEGIPEIERATLSDAQCLVRLAPFAEEPELNEQYKLRSLTIAERFSGENRLVMNNLNRLGLDALVRGDLAKSEEYFRRTLVLMQKLPAGSVPVASVLINLGVVASARGDFAGAERYLKQALFNVESFPSSSGFRAATLNNLGDLALLRGDLKEAREYLIRALALKEAARPNTMFLASTLSTLGEVAWKAGSLTEAEDWIRRALTIQERLHPGNLEVATDLHSMGEIAVMRAMPDQAEDFFRRALAIREELAPSSAAHAETLAALASVLLSQKRDDEAAKLYEKALDAFEGQTARLGGSQEVRSGFRARHAGYYRDYISLLLKQNQPEKAFEVLERSRARSLLEMLAEARVDLREGVAPALLEKERFLQQRISAKADLRAELLSTHKQERLAEVNRAISDLTAQYQEVEGQIRSGSPAYAAVTVPQPISAEEVRKNLKPGTLLLEYSLGEEQSEVWAIAPSAVRVFNLPGRAEIEKHAQRVHDLLTARVHPVKDEPAIQREARQRKLEAEFQQVARDLSRIVLGPVAAELGSNKLLIVGDGALNYVPFAVLPVPGASVRSGRFLPMIARHEIANLPSASVLTVLRQQADAGRRYAKTVAVLADPVFSQEDPRAKENSRQAVPDQQTNEPGATDRLTRSVSDIGLDRNGSLFLPRLPYSRQEALAIRSMVPPGDAVESLDFDATRHRAMTLEPGRYRIVHFSTHGLLDSKHPELSGLVFSLVDRDGKLQNGFLDLQDIYNLKLPADLVVLSACETGLGQEIAGEGLVGLTRGFMYAGTTRVVASLWSVGDNATAELMKRFYRAMLREGLTPSAALRKAQMEMWKNPRWSDAYYWGAFVVQGE